MISFLEIIIISITVYLEAEGDTFKSKQGVANVIYNRMLEKNKKAHEIVFKPKQFSCWNEYAYFLSRFSKFNKKNWIASVKATKKAINEDVTNGANHYVVIGVRRRWMKKAKHKIILGKHLFMKI